MPRLRARITRVSPNYLNAGDRENPHKQVMGTFDVELTLVSAKWFTFEQAVEYFRDQTDFALIPVGEEEEG